MTELSSRSIFSIAMDSLKISFYKIDMISSLDIFLSVALDLLFIFLYEISTRYFRGKV